MRKRVLISGTNGVLGGELVELLARDLPDWELVGLFRTERSRDAYLSRVPRPIAARLRPIVWDLTHAAETALALGQLGEADLCIGVHAAADVSWHKKIEAIRPVNVLGTRRFAQLLRSTSGVARLVYVSTAFTSGARDAHRNSYEQSKSEAERLVQLEFPDLAPVLFSCSLVVGRTRDGRISSFHGLYPLMDVINRFAPPIIPGDRDARIDIVPVDWVARELSDLVLRVLREHRAESVVATADGGSTSLAELAALACAGMNRYRARHGVSELPEIPIRSFRQWRFLRRTMKSWGLELLSDTTLKRLDRLLEIYRPYLEGAQAQASRNVSTPAPRLHSYLDPVVDYWLQETWKPSVERAIAGGALAGTVAP